MNLCDGRKLVHEKNKIHLKGRSNKSHYFNCSLELLYLETGSNREIRLQKRNPESITNAKLAYLFRAIGCNPSSWMRLVLRLFSGFSSRISTAPVRHNGRVFGQPSVKVWLRIGPWTLCRESTFAIRTALPKRFDCPKFLSSEHD